MLVGFFLFRCGFYKKLMPGWRNYFNWTADWGWGYSTPDTQNKLIIFLIGDDDVDDDEDDELRKAFSLISSRDHCQRSSPSQISDMPPTEPKFRLSCDNNYTTAPHHGVTPLHHGSICKYWISVNEDTSSLKQIEQICKCALSLKPGVFIVLTLIDNQN